MLIRLNSYPRQSVYKKGDLFHLSCFHKHALLSIQLVFQSIYSVSKMKENDWRLLLRLGFFRTLHIWYKVISNTCYMFLPIFLFLCFNQLVTSFTFASKTSSILLLLKSLPSNATKKRLVKIVEHKLLEVLPHSIRGDVRLGGLNLFSVPIHQQLPKLTSLYFFSFLKWPLKLDCTFPWQQSGGSKQLINFDGWNLIPCN